MAEYKSVLSKDQWLKVQLDYKSGNYKSISELAERYSIKVDTLIKAVKRSGWKDERDKTLLELSENVHKKTINEGEKYLKESFQRVKRYEKILDLSQDQLGSKSSDGTPLLDPEAIQDYVLTETRLHTWGKSCLMIPDASRSIDLTSKGQSLGESFASALNKLREDKSIPKISSQDVDRILEAEIVDDDVSTK